MSRSEIDQVPNSYEAERSVLSAVMMDPDYALPIVSTLEEADFYDANCRRLFSILCDIGERGETFDYIDLREVSVNRGYGESMLDFIIGTVGYTASSIRVEEHVKIVKDRSRRRQLLHGLGDLARDIYNTEVVMDNIIDHGDQILQGAVSTEHGGVTASQGVQSVLAKTHYYYANPIGQYETRGIDTGYRGLNAAIDGWKRNNVYYILGLEHSGKTTMGMNMIMRVCKNGGRCCVFSLEQSTSASENPQQSSLWERVILSQANVTTRQYQLGTLNDSEYTSVLEAGELVNQWDLTMYDDIYTLPGMEAALRKLQREAPLDLVMIDYLKLIQQSGSYGSRNEEIGGLTRKLKQLAVSLSIPIIVPHQVSSKQIANRKEKRIQLSDGYESGHIGQDADLVFGLNREELFCPDSDRVNIIDLDVLKDRVSGGTGFSIELYFNKRVGMISDIYT